MTLLQILFLVALFGSVGLALSVGGREERVAAIVIMVATLGTPMAQHQGFVGIEAGILLIDVLLLLALGWLALTSRSFWPLWATGFQLGALVVHITAGSAPDILPAAYAETLVIWSYPVLASLGVGSWFEARRRRQLR